MLFKIFRRGFHPNKNISRNRRINNPPEDLQAVTTMKQGAPEMFGGLNFE